MSVLNCAVGNNDLKEIVKVALEGSKNDDDNLDSIKSTAGFDLTNNDESNMSTVNDLEEIEAGRERRKRSTTSSERKAIVLRRLMMTGQKLNAYT